MKKTTVSQENQDKIDLDLAFYFYSLNICDYRLYFFILLLLLVLLLIIIKHCYLCIII